MEKPKLESGGATLYQGVGRESGKPLISVITVTFNAAQHLPDTLRTMRAQEYSNVEWIIIDGGSTDGTIDILRANEDVIDYWVSEPDQGMYDALAKGFERANGEILCWLNAGDMFLYGALSTVADIFKNHPRTNWITGINFWHVSGCKIISCMIPAAYSSDLIACGMYGKSLPYIQQESTFFRSAMLSTADMRKFRQFKLAGDLYLWTCFSKRDSLKVVCAGLGSFCVNENHQLSDDKVAYWKEASSFLERMTFTLWIKMLIRLPLRHAPLRMKKFLAGDNLLLWVGGRWS